MQKTTVQELLHVDVVGRDVVKSPQSRVCNESNQSESAPLNIFAQIESMRSLKDGWLDGEGKSPPYKALERFAQIFDSYWDDSLPLPHIYPTYEGGIQAEWLIGRCAISLEIELPSQKSYFHQIHLDTKEDFDMDLDLADRTGWETLRKVLNNVMDDSL